jgi:hypothetical protein
VICRRLRRPPINPASPHSIRRELVAGRRCITVVPQGAPLGGALELLVARSFQAAFRKAMDLAGWGGRLSTEETAP